MARVARRLLLPVALAVVVCACGQPESGPRGARGLVLLSVDTLRADHLGCYGYDRDTSPAIDALAAEGVLFEDVTAASSWTVPAHASMLTGVYPRTHAARGPRQPIAHDAAYLPELLSERGFATAAFVNVGMLGERRGFVRGFDTFEQVPPSRERGGAAERLVSRALDWMRTHGDEPFFVLLHLYDVHSDYRSLPRFEARFLTPYTGEANGSTSQLRRYWTEGRNDWGEDDARHLVNLYDAGIRQLDAALAGFLAGLEQAGLRESIHLVLTSDHGEAFLDHGSVLHGGTLYQEQVHVPLLLAGPGLPRGLRVSGQASHVDVLPTVLSLLGLPAHPDPAVVGIDLSRIWRQPGYTLAGRTVFAETESWPGRQPGQFRRLVRRGDLTLLESEHGRRLYDLGVDPAQQVDLAPQRPGIAEALARELEAFAARRRDSGLRLDLSEQERSRLRELGYLE